MHEYENFKNRMSNVSRGQAILERWAHDPRVELSEGGKNWLIAALDPFHDTILPQLQGFPDVSTGASVVQTVRGSFPVSATSGGHAVPTAPWDMHVAFVPILQPEPFIATSSRVNNSFGYNPGNAGSMPFGSLMARGVFETGQPVDYFPAGGSGESVLGGLTLDPAYSSGLSRVIGIGVEVRNDTAIIALQGSAVTYRQAEPDRQTSVFVGSNTADEDGKFHPFIFAGVPMRVPPRTTSDALLLAGSRQWNAKKGCYMVGALHSQSNPPQPVSYTHPVMFDADDEDTMTGNPASEINDSQVRVPIPTENFEEVAAVSFTPGQTFVGSLTLGASCVLPQKIVPVHQFGAIFTGLSPTSTFTVNWVVYVEQFPSVSNKTLIVMATPSLRFDPMALEIYSRALSVLPVAVPVGENGLGTWFANLVDEIEPFVTPLVSAFNPALGMISRGAGVASRAYLNNQKPQKSLMVTAPGGKNLDLKRKKIKAKNTKIAAGTRGKSGRIAGPFKGGNMPQMPK